MRRRRDEEELVPRRRLLGAVFAHVAAERLPLVEFHPANRTEVQFLRAAVLGAVAVNSRFLVAGPVAAERLEGMEPLPARLALELLVAGHQRNPIVVQSGQNRHAVGHRHALHRLQFRRRLTFSPASVPL
ncbi:unnamed protein product [Cuscuta campestris]|uniref:Uncharacterized protein n=1 Tax=Cuscuta campestris TaxID=132261 RepID=A0A484NBT2_9ASTE|nr:unnamed protein product [Cuscuta campestris]